MYACQIKKRRTVGYQLGHAKQGSPSPTSSRPHYLPHARLCPIMNELGRNVPEKDDSCLKGDLLAVGWGLEVCICRIIVMHTLYSACILLNVSCWVRVCRLYSSGYGYRDWNSGSICAERIPQREESLLKILCGDQVDMACYSANRGLHERRTVTDPRHLVGCSCWKIGSAGLSTIVQSHCWRS